MEASVRKYKNREQVFVWLKTLPERFTMKEVDIYISRMKVNDFMVWTKEDGLI